MLTRTIPSVLYVQYNDDADVQAFVDAFNDLAQEYVTWFAEAFLPVWPLQSGDLLSWTAWGIYGIRRPVMPAGDPRLIGAYNTTYYNSIPYNGRAYVFATTFADASDDIYKRILTWALYKGDGRQFTVEWLKRRVERFLIGTDGDAVLQDTYNVSVEFDGGAVVTIRLEDYPDLDDAQAFAYALRAGYLETPFQYTFRVVY